MNTQGWFFYSKPHWWDKNQCHVLADDLLPNGVPMYLVDKKELDGQVRDNAVLFYYEYYKNEDRRNNET